MAVTVAVIWSWIAWYMTYGDQNPALAWACHVPVYLACSILSRVYGKAYLGGTVGLMFALSFDIFIQQLPGLDCSQEECSFLKRSGFRLVSVLLAVSVSVLSAMLIDPIFAAEDLRNELYRMAQFVFFQLNLVVRELCIHGADQAVVKPSMDVHLLQSELEPTVTEIQRVENQVLQSTLIVELLSPFAKWEPRIAGHFDQALVKSLARKVWRISSRISQLLWYDHLAGREEYRARSPEEEDAVRRLLELRGVPQSILVRLYGLSHTLRPGGYMPGSLRQEIEKSAQQMKLAELERIFDVQFVVGCPSSFRSEEQTKVAFLNLEGSFAQVYYLKLICFIRIAQLMVEVSEDVQRLYGHDDGFDQGNLRTVTS